MAELDPQAGPGLPSLADIGPFLARLVRLDPAALVRLRPAGAGRLTVWGRVPWRILVCRTVPAIAAPAHGPTPLSTVDMTLPAGQLLDGMTAGRAALPERRDAQWRWPLPGSAGEPVESVPAADLVRLGAAAASTLRSGSGRFGERVLRDAILDHVAIEVRSGEERVEVRQGLIQALLRMGFVTERMQETVTVRTLGDWVGLEAAAGQVWAQNRTNLAINILR
jgi:hypothetical protein